MKKILNKLFVFFEKPIKKLFGFIAQKSKAQFVNLSNATKNSINSHKKSLQKNRDMMYNSKEDNGIDEQNKGSEQKSAIKARVRTN